MIYTHKSYLEGPSGPSFFMQLINIKEKNTLVKSRMKLYKRLIEDIEARRQAMHQKRVDQLNKQKQDQQDRIQQQKQDREDRNDAEDLKKEVKREVKRELGL